MEQFIRLARNGYYDGSAFHRVVMNGIIQGGDPLLKNSSTPRNLWGTGGLNTLAAELSDLKHERGVVSTVHIPNKADSDGSQFFVCVVPQPPLDGQYSTFGRVTEGMDVVEHISQVPVDSNGLTEKPVRILKVTIEKKKVEPFLNASMGEMRRTVTMKTTLGTVRAIEISFAWKPDWAPENVRNFLGLTASGWYNGTIFHRIVKGFCVVRGGTSDKSAHRRTVSTRPTDGVHPVKGRIPKRCETRARHRVHGAQRPGPTECGDHFVFLCTRSGDESGRPVFRVRPDRGRHGCSRCI